MYHEQIYFLVIFNFKSSLCVYVEDAKQWKIIWKSDLKPKSKNFEILVLYSR